jgi:hypothetical protein
MAAQHAEVLQPFLRGLLDDQRGGRRGGLEADGEEHHLALGCWRAIFSASAAE